MGHDTKPGIYRHYKGGLYRVLHVARLSTNGDNEGDLLVVYVSLTNGKIFARDEREFNEWVESHGPEGSFEGLRFTWVGEEIH